MQRGRRHKLAIDGQTIWLDSLNEEIALRCFIDVYNFSGKWARPVHGIKHAGKYYSPDFELAIDDHGHTARALIEVKQYRRDFTEKIAERMRTVANHYPTDYLFLYTVKSDKWYRITLPSGLVRLCDPPQPGSILSSELTQPTRFVTKSYHGRRYNQSLSDGLTSILRNFLNPRKRK